MDTARIGEIHIVLGHVGIFRSLVRAAQLSVDSEKELFDALQRKAFEEIDSLLDSHVDDDDIRRMLRELSRLSGDESVLTQALDAFGTAPSSVRKELAELEAIALGVKKRLPAISLGFDLCELRGYEYHTGIVFAAYTPGYGRAVAQGGRYDDIGQVFGRARPASGFDSDLKVIARLSQTQFDTIKAISAPCSEDPALADLIVQLRRDGERVVVDLAADEEPAHAAHGCRRRITRLNGQWLVQELG